MKNKKKYSDEELLDFLHKFKSDFNRVPSSTDITRADGYPAGNIYTKRFGSYKKALDLAGLKRSQYKNNKYSDKYLLESYFNVYNYYKRTPSKSEYSKFKSEEDSSIPSLDIIKERFGNTENIHKLLGIKPTRNKYNGYDRDFLISELKRFNKENNRPPTSTDLDGDDTGFPTRKTYEKYFESFGKALEIAGFPYRGIENFQERKKPLPNGVISFSKEQLRLCIDEYVEKYKEVPSLKDIEEIKNYPDRNDFRRLFGSYNNALREFGYQPPNVHNYTDKELKDAFLKFVEKEGRIPSMTEFNNSEYPSFWCYQERFGSWNKAVESYGFESTKSGTGFCHKFDDGELVKSRYEYDTSLYFREKGIKYERDVLYKHHIEGYNGRMNCDYVIDIDGDLLFIEIAGFINNHRNKSSIEKDYIRRFKTKLNLLNNSELNYRIIYPKDFETKTLDEIYSFLFVKKTA